MSQWRAVDVSRGMGVFRGGCSRLHIMYVGDAAALYIYVWPHSLCTRRVCVSQPAVYVRIRIFSLRHVRGRRERACPGMRRRPRPGPQPLSGHSIAPCRGHLGAHLQVDPGCAPCCCFVQSINYKLTLPTRATHGCWCMLTKIYICEGYQWSKINL